MTSYNVQDYGAIGDGSVANAGVNTAAFLKAMALASNPASPGKVYVPPSQGFVVNNGQLSVMASNLVIEGDASMGSNPAWWPTSTIIGHGPGSTFTVLGSGCSIRGLAWKPITPGEQKGGDAFILVQGTQVSLANMYFNSPNIGISLQMPIGAAGEFWLSDIEMEGGFSSGGIVVNIGNAAVRMSHIVMNNWQGPQPSFGILITAAGEVVLDGGSDIIAMGNCLSIIPGLNGVKNQIVSCVKVTGCLFDSGNGLGCVYIGPQSNGSVLTVRFVNTWASKAGNAAGMVTNGFTFDGSLAVQSLLGPIQDVTLVACEGKSFTGHCGLYAKGVQALTVMGCTFGDNFMGVWLAGNCTDSVITGNKCGAYVPGLPGQAGSGNTDHGIFLEGTVSRFIVTNNIGFGNGKGNVLSLAAPGTGIISGNFP